MDISNMTDFEKMSRAELRAYLVAHPDNQEAFYKFVDRFKADPNGSGWHPPVETLEDLARVSQLIEQRIKELERNQDKPTQIDQSDRLT